jgi:hypothetical protein
MKRNLIIWVHDLELNKETMDVTGLPIKAKRKLL